MHFNNNNKSKNFIQGLRPFSNSIPKTLRKYLRKGGYNYSNVVDNWTQIVDKKISNSCYPTKIKIGKEMRNGTLILNVAHGSELMIEYSKKEIIDKINSFFGYNCINKIDLKVVENRIKTNSNNFPKIKNTDKILKKIESLKNEQLKTSLNEFLKAFNERSK
tara:strand:+ start:56 stop:541 length:486 start_codon:yes stop_codon:yes gene_type:complete